jgi:hypothetical protein
MTTTQTAELRELDHRVSDGIDVRLLWRPEDDRAIVAVSDAKTGGSFTLEVAPHQRAMDVFHHPYAYAPEGVGTSSPGGELTGAPS